MPITFLSSGTYYIRACADKKESSDEFGKINESNEKNNCSNWVELNVMPGGQPIDGYWTYTWGACSAQCGGGTQTGTGICIPPVNGGAPCPPGGGTLTQQSNTQACSCSNGAVNPSCTLCADGSSPESNPGGVCPGVNICANNATNYPACTLCSDGSTAASNPGGICPGGSGDGGVLNLSFKATPTVIFKGRSSTLTWSSEADSCTSSDFATGGVASNATTGVKVYPTSTKTYNITCTKDLVSESGTATVKVISPIIIER